MPANTARGYTYPLYTDTQNFPAQIQDLATDIDTDVTFVESNIAGARERPSARMIVGNFIQNVPTSTLTTVSFVPGTVPYDNDSMAVPALSRLELTDRGVYLITARVTVNAAGGSVYGLSMALLSSLLLTPTISRTSRRAHPTQDTGLNLTSLHFHNGVGTDLITLQLLHDAGSNRAFTFRNMCATKISNTIGGS